MTTQAMYNLKLEETLKGMKILEFAFGKYILMLFKPLQCHEVKRHTWGQGGIMTHLGKSYLAYDKTPNTFFSI